MKKLLISFDDTGSMSSVRKQVRQKIGVFVHEIFDIIEDLEIAIIIHNDYCDKDLIQKLDFTSSLDEIERFINRSSSMGGGDHREAYAYVLNEMKSFSWDEGGVAIMIGDAPPHEKGSVSAGTKELYDWREEVVSLLASGIKVYPVQALNGGGDAKRFYEGISKLSGTPKLDLAQFNYITQYITAILHREAGTLDTYQESLPEFKTNISLRNMFAVLGGKILDAEFAAKSEMLGRFQVSEVPYSQTIKDYVVDMGISYRAGKGYYQLTKPEKIQKGKEVLFVNKKTGETVADTHWCRLQLGVPYGTEGKIRPGLVTREFDVFVQSTSYTRKLMPGTKFLYEIDAK